MRGIMGRFVTIDFFLISMEWPTTQIAVSALSIGTIVGEEVFAIQLSE